MSVDRINNISNFRLRLLNELGIIEIVIRWVPDPYLLIQVDLSTGIHVVLVGTIKRWRQKGIGPQRVAVHLFRFADPRSIGLAVVRWRTRIESRRPGPEVYSRDVIFFPTCGLQTPHGAI